MKAEVFLPLLGKLLPMGSHRLEQVEGAAHVALDERRRPIDRAIDVALGCQVHHQVGIGLAHGCGCGIGVGEVHPQQLVALNRLGAQAFDAGEIAGVTQLVEIEHRGAGIAQQPAHQRPANEAGAAGNQHAVDPFGQ